MDVMIFLLFGVLAVICFFMAMIIKQLIVYKHDFILKKPAGNSFIAMHTKAKEGKTKDGVDIWVLKKPKKEVPIPDKKYLGINKKGKFYVEAWLLEDGQVQYEEHLETEHKAVDVSSTNQKIMFSSQLERAQKERFRSWKEILPQVVVPIGALVILALVILSFLMFGQDLAEPYLTAKDKDTAFARVQKESLEILKEIKNDVQIIKSEQDDLKETKPID